MAKRDANIETYAVDAAIHYVLPQVPFELTEATPFQGFAPGTLASASMIDVVLTLPASILDFGATRENAILTRSLGYDRYRIVPIESNVLGALPIRREQPFWCFLSNDQTIDRVRELLRTLSAPILHFTTVEVEDVPNISTLDRKLVLNYVKRVLDYLVKQQPIPLLRRWQNSLRKWPAEVAAEKLKITEWGHNATYPNLAALGSVGYKFKRFKPLSGDNPDYYARAIVEGASRLREVRDAVLDRNDRWPLGLGPATGFILAAPTVYRHLYRSSEVWKSMTTELGKKRTGFIRDFVARRPSFYVRMSSTDVQEFSQDAVVQTFVSLRAQELHAYARAIAVMAASDFAPVVRLSPSIEKFQDVLKAIGMCARGNSPHRSWKLNKLVRRLTRDLADEIGPLVVQEIARNQGAAKIVTDVPLEWLPVNGVPLCLRHSTSRLPTTPGNLMFGECVARRNLWFVRDQFLDVLIVRSFDKSDHLRDILKNSLETMLRREPSNLRIQFKDVATVDELIETLNSYSGQILIFDGHGSTVGDGDMAGVVVGGTVVNSWELRGKARIPPIVILSACDTHPVDGSHASAANGFIAAGACTVLATLLPVHARRAANFVCRLLYRIDEFMRVIIQNRGAIRWSEVIGGFQRMVYLSDLLTALAEKGYLTSRETWDRLQLAGNGFINSGDPEWYEKTVNLVCEACALGAAEFQDFVTAWFQLPEVLIYVQIGNPETIVIREH